jgi:hypothetical protein
MNIMLKLENVTKIYPGAEHIKAVEWMNFHLTCQRAKFAQWLGHPAVARLQP